MSKQKELLSTDFFYMLVIFLFVSAGIAYLFYSMGYSHAVEQIGTMKIQNLQEESYGQMEDVEESDNSL